MTNCTHKRRAHRFCRDFAVKPEPYTRDEAGELIVGCVNCAKAPTFDNKPAIVYGQGRKTIEKALESTSDNKQTTESKQP